MLTDKEIALLELAKRDGTHSEVVAALGKALVEIKLQRPVVKAALACTGEDGHDGVTDLVCAAEEYLEKIT